jgi:hypothetical protein
MTLSFGKGNNIGTIKEGSHSFFSDSLPERGERFRIRSERIVPDD